MQSNRLPVLLLILVLASCAHVSGRSRGGPIVDTEDTLFPELVRRTEARIGVLRVLIYRHVRSHNLLPERLEPLVEPLKGEGVTLMDAWGRRMAYSRTEAGYEIRSAGKDGLMKSDDDIVGTGDGRNMPQYDLFD